VQAFRYLFCAACVCRAAGVFPVDFAVGIGGGNEWNRPCPAADLIERLSFKSARQMRSGVDRRDAFSAAMIGGLDLASLGRSRQQRPMARALGCWCDIGN
jgi:hypothetical protein